MAAQRDRLVRSGLQALISEASLALAHLDAGRLEELAIACQVLTRGLPQKTVAEREEMFAHMRAATAEMETLRRVLAATRSNVRVLQRLQQIRAARVEYSEAQARGWTWAEANDGHD